MHMFLRRNLGKRVTTFYWLIALKIKIEDDVQSSIDEFMYEDMEDVDFEVDEKMRSSRPALTTYQK